MMRTLKEIKQAIEKHAAPPSLTPLLRKIPSLRAHNQALASLQSYKRRRIAYAETQASIARRRHTAHAHELQRGRERLVNDAVEVFAEFGIEVPHQSTAALEGAWESVMDGLERAEREDRVLGRTSNGVAAQKAGTLRHTMDRIHTLDQRITVAKAKVDGVDPLEIDEELVGYSNEYTARGAVANPGYSSFPMLDPELEARLVRFGILDGSEGETA